MNPDHPPTDTHPDERLAQLTDWVRQFDGLENAVPVPASVDASFRRYYRVQNHGSVIVMDAPPAQEDCRRFIRVAGYLESMQLNCPRIIAADLDRGFLMITDLGSVQYLEALRSAPSSANDLYDDALNSLLHLQSRGRAYQGKLPAYDESLLRTELSVFRTWLCDTHLDLRFSADDDARWQACCDVLVDCALAQPTVFVHRDYHSRNLMVTAEDNPGILDFQDALEGPYTYDLVSLLKDCYIKHSSDFVADYAERFVTQCDHGVTAERFLRDFDLMGMQRHLKAAGIFARLLHRDGKDGYLDDIPRTLRYVVDAAPAYAELSFLAALVEERVLPRLAEVNRCAR